MSEVSGEEDGRAAGIPNAPQSAAFEEPAPAAPLRPGRAGRPGRQAIGWLAVVLAVVIAGVATAPFWSPAVMPFLPWGPGASPPTTGYAALAARLEALEQRPAAASEALDRLRSQQAVLAQRLDRLDTAPGQQAANAGTLQKLQQDVARLDGVTARLDDRLGALEAKSKSQASAAGSDAALLLALLELREAVAAGRPFAAEYQGFAALARGRPGLEAAAAPLASSAGDGIASLAALREELSRLGVRLAPTTPLPREWWRQALLRVRGLVTIRRIGAPESGAKASVASAQAALAGGDLAGAVTAAAALSGADAAAAWPWLQQARARLAAEAALNRLQQELTARLGAAPAAAPAGSPSVAPAKSGAPS